MPDSAGVSSDLKQSAIPGTSLFARTQRSRFANTGDANWVRFDPGEIILQVDGAATAVTVVLDRMTCNPDATGLAEQSYAPVTDTNTTGNPATGIQSRVFMETGIAWWRPRVTSLTGAPVFVSLSGRGA